ncbi:hypothetical protein T35B1_10521 [Salinisphaera shabanensis T35B1]|jgi:hypothetical protein
MHAIVVLEYRDSTRHIQNESRIDLDHSARVFKIAEMHDCRIAETPVAPSPYRFADFVMACYREIVLPNRLFEIENGVDKRFFRRRHAIVAGPLGCGR